MYTVCLLITFSERLIMRGCLMQLSSCHSPINYLAIFYKQTYMTLKPRPHRQQQSRTFDFVEATFSIVERIVPLVAFDNVASTLLLHGVDGALGYPEPIPLQSR